MLAMHYDPARPSQLEKILTETQFPPALLARAAALRARITAANITKYNLAETPLTLPATPGRRRILVVGQVEDDASIRHGAGRVRSNAHLLAAARAVEPHAFIIYKPHPDVQTGYRRGYLPAREARRHADMVVTTGNIGTLLAQVHALHSITSLAGFEALLRGVAVTTWGAPFYAGWGLTDDHEPPPRRSRRLSLDALVAGCLILYPRYQDPVTLLPCPPELLLDRLAEPSLWPPLPPGRRAYLAWWRLQGQMLKFARATGLWRR
jgi:capsular polysaccharide export protein